MKKQYLYAEVYSAARMGFGALYAIARKDIKGAWNKMTVQEKYKAARGLVCLRDMAQAPDKYLSRVQTEDAWHARAYKYAADKNLPNVWMAANIVPGPVEMVQDSVGNALTFSYGDGRAHGGFHWNQWYNLASDLKNYDYNITSERTADREWSQNFAQKVVERSKRLTDHAEAAAAKNVFKRALLELRNSFTESEYDR